METKKIMRWPFIIAGIVLGLLWGWVEPWLNQLFQGIQKKITSNNQPPPAA